MQKNVLLELLSEGFGAKQKGDLFELPPADRAAILISADGTMVAVEDVRHVAVRAGYLVARTGDQGETYLLSLDRIIGLKVQHGKKGGAGFVS